MRLKYKIIALNIAALILMLIITGPIITEITDSYNLSTTLRFLQSQGNYASIYTEQYALNKARSVFEVPSTIENDASYLCALLKRTVKCRVQIFNNSKLLGDSEDIIDNVKTIRPEVQQALNGKRAYIISKSTPRVFYYSVPVDIGNRYMYAIAFIYELGEEDLMKTNTLRIFIVTAMLASVFVIMFSTVISNRLISPINKLNRISASIAKGNFDSRIEVTTKDEVGELSETFNIMADSIQDTMHKIKDEKEKQKSFFDNFTHEIRTPLTTIIGYTELLWKTDNQEVKDKSLFHISSEAKRMLKMVETLLELSRLKKFDFELNLTLCNLKKLIEEVCDSMQYKARRYNIEINLQLEDIDHFVDADHFKQIIINIIDNSIKYSGSSIIDISLFNDEVNNTIELMISDYGKGIDKDDLECIFDPYYKVDKSRNSKIEGWGLGLSIVKEIVSKHNGEISIESSPETGTKVIISYRR